MSKRDAINFSNYAALDAAFAFDKSARRIDIDGRLHVEKSNISKATVNPYLGKEIPNWQTLGLEPEKIYQLFRDPKELKKGADTFNNIPLLSKHVPVSAEDHQPDLVVGSTGTDAKFESPYLTNSLVVWESVAIAGIETREQCELSCAYRYTPVMEAGTFDGQPYDGRMTEIIGNHVALVEIGRAGSDVVVADSMQNLINQKEEMTMTRKEKMVLAHAAAIKIAQDAGISRKDLAKLLGLDAESVSKLPDEPKLKGASDEDDEKREDESDEEYEERMKAKKKKPAEDAEEDEGDPYKESKAGEKTAKEAAEGKPNKTEAGENNKKAMDAAIKVAQDAAVKRIQDIAAAEKAVKHIVGEVAALDSAEAVYKVALDHLGVDVTGVHPSAYAALVKLAGTTKKAVVAQDSSLKSNTEFKEMFPNAVIPKKG
jgi:hypothetical protein